MLTPMLSTLGWRGQSAQHGGKHAPPPPFPEVIGKVAGKPACWLAGLLAAWLAGFARLLHAPLPRLRALSSRLAGDGAASSHAVRRATRIPTLDRRKATI